MNVVDLTALNWSTTHNGGVSYGCYYKASEVKNGVKWYYKCSNFYQGQEVFGDESVNEVICSRLLNILGFNCVNYTLVLAKIKIQGRYYITYVCKSKNFFKGYSSRVTLEDYHSINGGNINEVINKLGISLEIQDMILADFLTLQRDRHGGNIELLECNNKYKLAPLFDNGLGLLAPYPSAFGTNIETFDVMFDYPVNNYIGTRSLYNNLGYIKRPKKVNRLLKEHKKKIFFGLGDVLPKDYRDKIWQLITYRYMFLRKRGYIID